MFKNSKNNIDLENWFKIIHNDLCNIHEDNQNKKESNSSKRIRSDLAGFRDSLLYDACSGVGFIHDGKYYLNAEEAEKIIEKAENIDEINIVRVISVDYLLNIIEQILRK